MRTRLLLALLSVPVLCAVVPRPADAQRYRYRDHGRVYVYRDGRGFRDHVYVSRHRYKEPVVYRRTYRYGDDDYRYRDNDYRYRDSYRYRNDDYRYRDELYYRNQYRYRDRDRYRYDYRRRRTNIADLILIAAREAAYRDRYSRHRHGRRGHGVGIYIGL